MYNVGLDNGQCLFDTRDGFETIADLLDWARGRCGKYRIHIDTDSDTHISLAYDDDTEIYSYYDGCDWVNIRRPELVTFLQKIL